MSEINKIYLPLYTSSKRYFFITGGRASLKSSTVHDFIARLTYESGHGVLFTRYTMTSAEKSIIPEFSLTIERLGIQNDFHVTKNVVTNVKSGSFIYFSGIKTSSGDQTANLKSLSGITTWVIEEGEDFKDEKTFDTIDDSIRTNSRQNRVICIQNPSTKEHFIYKRWIAPANYQVKIQGYNVTVSNMPQVEHIHSTYHIGIKYLSEQWIEKANGYQDKALTMTDKYKSWYYTNYIGGWLEKEEGVVFETWTEGVFDAFIPFCYAQDYGFSPDPLGLLKVAVDNKLMKIYIQEMIYDQKLSNDQIVNRYQDLGIKKTDLIVTDTNEPRTTNELQKLGYNIIPAVKREIVEDIREIQKYELVVCGESPNLKMELNHYVWNDKKASIPIDAYNHLIDPLRYGYRKLTTSFPKLTFASYSR
jgi:phage terminase large subunit